MTASNYFCIHVFLAYLPACQQTQPANRKTWKYTNEGFKIYLFTFFCKKTEIWIILQKFQISVCTIWSLGLHNFTKTTSYSFQLALCYIWWLYNGERLQQKDINGHLHYMVGNTLCDTWTIGWHHTFQGHRKWAMPKDRYYESSRAVDLQHSLRGQHQENMVTWKLNKSEGSITFDLQAVVYTSHMPCLATWVDLADKHT